MRYAADAAGRYSFETICSDTSNPDLHGRRGVLEVAPYEGTNPLLSRGPLRVASRPPLPGARRRHAVFLAGRYLVDGIVEAPALARRFRAPGGGPCG